MGDLDDVPNFLLKAVADAAASRRACTDPFGPLEPDGSKIFFHDSVKDELRRRARQQGKGLSELVREICIRHLYGAEAVRSLYLARAEQMLSSGSDEGKETTLEGRP